ncbi:MAG TPA: alanine--tRNA ligase, partial [Firmicutes bacterium]|nr:alanine--tRNA ligase [Bacillota bacterium]
MNANELRKTYIEYFGAKNHEIKKSFSLIPDDPSLLFTVAGMVPFKNYFLGKAPLVFTRAVSCQKCIRTNDIENVGRTRRHHTFFEMLGNFSFGDYFKEETIKWAWEFLTEIIKLPKNRLYVTVFTEDDEAYDIWKDKIKVPEDRIFRLGKETNFWEMGTVGPCGYCSEIYFDLEGGEKGRVSAEDIEKNDDRFLEIWNLVFTQFDKKEDGTLGELAQKNIDTGMGLERLAAVSQGVYSNFESDLFMPIINDAAKRTNKKYGEDEKTDVSLRVIADHCRGVVFLIGDGVLPSNEGRGYVLRRIIRRAVRHGRLLGLKKLFFSEIVPVVTHIMEEAYPEISERKDYISDIIKMEEEKFGETMDKGMEILEREIETMKKEGVQELSGAVLFKLYDTFGFPAEITEEILEENGMSADRKGFDEAMEKQREKAKAAWKGFNAELAEKIPADVIEKTGITEFMGYCVLYDEGCKVLGITGNGKELVSAEKGKKVEVILDKTPFYAESGGQSGDTGILKGEGFEIRIDDTQKFDQRHIHIGEVAVGTVKKGDLARAVVDEERRKAVMKNHTATHLLHSALRRILGNHVEQAGSYVGSERLRFDFTHFAQLTGKELDAVEAMVNEWVQESGEIEIEEMEFSKAKEKGAIALFDEKYGEKVRAVSVKDISMELCGGTHIKNTGQIGFFKITGAGSTAAGIRRI